MSVASATYGARRAANSRGMDLLARLGLTARAVIYLLIGVLALMLAFGHKAGETDQRGAMQDLARQSGGFAILLVVAIGLAGYALWRFSEAVFGVAGEGKKAGARAQSFVRGLIYAALAASAFRILVHGRQKSQAKQQQSDTARLMAHSGGRWLVGAIGAVIVVIGVVLVYQGVTRHFEKYFKRAQMSRTAWKTTQFLGTVGTSARGIVFGATGVFVVVAAVQFDPGKARGLDGTLTALRTTAAGPLLLALLAIGLILFGLFGLCEARWRRT